MAVLQQTGLTVHDVEDMYQVMAIANYEDRFVIPSTAEYAEDAFDVRGGCGSPSATAAPTAPPGEHLRRQKPRTIPSRPWSEGATMFKKTPETMRLTLRALARLLAYPAPGCARRCPH